MNGQGTVGEVQGDDPAAFNLRDFAVASAEQETIVEFAADEAHEPWLILIEVPLQVEYSLYRK